jgi:hypothetical protein
MYTLYDSVLWLFGINNHQLVNSKHLPGIHFVLFITFGQVLTLLNGLTPLVLRLEPKRLGQKSTGIQRVEKGELSSIKKMLSHGPNTQFQNFHLLAKSIQLSANFNYPVSWFSATEVHFQQIDDTT